MFEMLLGHLVGDNLLQTEWMALTKGKYTLEGWIAALVHCLIYTFVVCLFMWNFHPIWIVAVFLTHFPIDKFALGEKYMHYVKGKGMKDYVKKDIPQWERTWEKNGQITRYDIFEGGFTSVVYTVTDNTMHLLLMWGSYKLLYGI
jgi:hypothetical protein